MKRRAALLACVLAGLAHPAHGQAMIGGRVVDAETRNPLPCVAVVLEDSSGTALGYVTTAADGVFVLSTPARGTVRPHFIVWGAAPMYGPSVVADSTTDSQREYVVTVTRRSGGPFDGIDTARAKPPVAIGGSLRIQYPERLRASGQRGDVVMRFAIDTTGRVVRASEEVVSSSAREFRQAVESALPRMRFTPARLEGEPVCAMVLLPFAFSLAPSP